MTKKTLKKFVEVKGRTSNGKVNIDCAFCKGEGETRTKVCPFARTCPACKGTGKFKLLKPSITCVFCGSTGRDKKDPKVTCIVCRGRGANSVKKGYKVCTKCHGSCKEPESQLPCIFCRGTGVAQKRWLKN